MTVEEYLDGGAKLSNLDIDKTICGHYDKNRDKKIVGVEDRGDLNDHNTPLLWLTYEDGSEKRYAAGWLKTTVQVAMDSKYF